MRVVPFTIPVAQQQSVIVQEDRLPHFYPHLHRHNEAQITWIVKGSGVLMAGNYMQAFRPGNLYIIGANQPHVFKSDAAYFDKRKKQQVRALTLFFNPSGQWATVLDMPEMKAVKKFIDRMGQGLLAPAAAAQRLSAAMEAVQRSKNAQRITAFIGLLQLCAEVKHWQVLNNAPSAPHISDTEGQRMSAIYQYTLTHYHQPIRLQQVADVAYLTKPAFCRYFKKHTRKTYVNFVNEIRIHEACGLLLSGRFESVAAVADATGFTNAMSFNRVFRKMVGKAPLQYRREFSQGEMG
jgi:AraC-like DNA-binding protein